MPRRAVVYLLTGDQFPTGGIPDGVIERTVVELDALKRAGLADALGSIAGGHADTLVVARLSATAGSLGELLRLLDWLGEQGASMIALDVGLDTAGRAGQRTLAALREVHRWTREPALPRRPAGRPGIGSTAPAVARRISNLRQQGLSLHAIAAALNAEGIPTPRGGSSWRASSVQSALGYRRPRPPVPGARPGIPGRAGKPAGSRREAPMPRPRP